MTSRRRKSESEDMQQTIEDIGVVDLILLDHWFVKECIEVLLDEKADKKRKLSLAPEFLDALYYHSMAEKKAIYDALEGNEELHFTILESKIEHGIVDQKIKEIRNKLQRSRVLKDEVEAELKVLAELVKNHLIEEESTLLPAMLEAVDDETLLELGADFMRLRKMSPSDLMAYPMLEEELVQWKDSVQKVSSELLNKMDKYVENLRH